MIAPGFSMDTVKIPPLVVEVRHLVWKHRNHLQKCCRNFSQSTFKCASRTLASKERTSFRNIGQYEDHMQSNNLQEAWPLILVSFTLSKPIQGSARSHAGKVYQNYSTDWNVHFFKMFRFLATDEAKMVLAANQRGDRLQVCGICCLLNLLCYQQTSCEEPSRYRMVWEEYMGGEPSVHLVTCLAYFQTASQTCTCTT